MPLWRIPIRQKDPDEDEIFEFDWTDYLNGSIISSVTWVIPSGITSYTTSNTNSKAYIGLRGGTLGETYTITCRMTTSDSPARKPDRSMYVKIVVM